MNYIKICHKNSQIFKNKYYLFENKKIFIDEYIDNIEKNTHIVKSIDEAVIINRKEQFIIKNNIINCGSITALLRLRQDGFNENIIVLNFANAMFPGGAYILGGNAQEESLCRASLLFYSLKHGKYYYNYNRKHIMPIYSDNMIYSENIPIIRNDDGNLLENITTASFITCPAVNKRFAKFFYSNSKINKIMELRIKKIVEFSAQKQPQAIIFGAYGCGVFGNNRDFVYSTFEKYINEFIPNEIKVVFAVK